MQLFTEMTFQTGNSEASQVGGVPPWKKVRYHQYATAGTGVSLSESGLFPSLGVRGLPARAASASSKAPFLSPGSTKHPGSDPPSHAAPSPNCWRPDCVPEEEDPHPPTPTHRATHVSN